jgi:nucleoside-diphosphate-sugar epimerase
VHIDDLIEALILAKDKGISGEVYLVSGKESKTQKELFSILAACLNVSPPGKSVPEFMVNSLAYYEMFTASLKGKNAKITPSQIARITSNRQFDISKASKELGFEPKIGYEQGAKEIVEEYVAKKRNKTEDSI